MAQIIDISWPISPTTTSYKNTKPISLVSLKSFSSDAVRDTNLTFNTHTGTHVDAPSHFIEYGNTIDQIPLNFLIGSAIVIDLSFVNDYITEEILQIQKFNSGDIVLLKTKNSQLSPTATFNFDFVYLAASGAQFLTQHSIKAVGIDYLGIERNDPAHSTHSIFLEKNIPIIEGLRLAHVAPGRYELYCLPLAIIGLEAAPARAILIAP